jgi:sialate O-acetylesterase
MSDFSAAAYFFAERLHENLNIPIGVINTAWGGTPIEVWINPDVEEVKAVNDNTKKIFEGFRWSPSAKGVVYNAMIAPLVQFKIAGVIWYQGESNTRNASDYASLFPALINNWRRERGAEFPFYYVQIAPFDYGEGRDGAPIREAQLNALSLPATGMAVISDIAAVDDIHPKNKREVGRRLAGWALAKTYGKKGIDFSGPIYSYMRREGGKIRIYFKYTADSLIARGGELRCFEIAGEDKKFIKAEAEIEGKTVVVYSPKVRVPLFVRFACGDTDIPNLFNSAGLPASCFSTDHGKQ